MTAEPRVDAEPFDLGRGRDAVLCLHGLTGTPYEVRPLAEALAAGGLRAVGPRLPGHGSAPERLAATGWEQWLDTAREALGDLRQRHERVSVVGLSLGGLLALALAAETPVHSLVALGTPLWLRRRARWLLPVIQPFKPLLPKTGGSDIREPGARARHPSMKSMPVASIRQLLRFQRHVRGCLPRVMSPILVAHGRLDRTADPSDAQIILRRVGSGERELVWLPNSGHVLPVDYDGAELSRAVVGFVTRARPALR